MNLAVVSGIATAPPTYGTTAAGTPVANVRVAVVTERDEGGSTVSQRDYFNCSYYAEDARERFEGIAPGDRVSLIGRLRSGRTVGADGSRAYHATLVAASVNVDRAKGKGEGHGIDCIEGGA